MIKNIFFIGMLGSLGSLLRYFITLLLKTQHIFGLPLGNMTSNILGCAFAGVLWGLSSKIPTEQKEIFSYISIGFLGSLTTFSALITETRQLLQSGNYVIFFSYIILNIFFGLGLFWLSEKGIRYLLH